MRWIPLALALPLVLLIVYGTRSYQAEKLRTETRLKAEAEHWASLASNVLSQGDPFVSVSSEFFDGERKPASPEILKQLEELRETGGTAIADTRSIPFSDSFTFPHGYTASGIPLYPLALRAMLDQADDKVRTSLARELLDAVIDHPSLLSARLAHDAESAGAIDVEKSRMALLATEAVTVIEARRDDWSANRPWAEWQGVSWFADFDESGDVRVTSVPYVQEWADRQLASIRKDLPEHLGIKVIWRSHHLEAVRPVSVHLSEKSEGAFAVTAGLRSTADWGQLLDKRQSWSLISFLVAIGIAGAALGTIYVALRRQATLNALQSDFIASVSHELRTPVASIGVLAERLESDKADAAQSTQYRQFIARETKRLAALVDNILDFSRIEQGRKRYDLEPADVPTLVRETVNLMEPRAEEKSIALSSSISESDQALPNVDALSLRQALVNLIDNAIKFSPPHSCVSVKLAPGQNEWRLSVCDKGPGIAPEEHARVFERFYRVESGLRRETRGAGIGLSIVQHIVRAHGGQVHVESRLGHGSTFTIHLPNVSA